MQLEVRHGHTMKCRLLILILYFTVAYAKWCGNCPPGFIVKSCKNNSTAICQPCPTDSYKLGSNALTQCTRCTDCIGRNNIEVQKCNGTHDRVCKCRHGYWYDTGVLFCSICSACRKGKGVVNNCTFTSDTKCQRCIKGVTFSPVYSKIESCRPCKKCGDNEEQVKLCTRRKDTECKPIPVKKIFQIKNKSNWPDKEKGGSSSTEGPTTRFAKNYDHTAKADGRVTTDKEESFETTSVSLAAVKQEEAEDNLLEIILFVIGGIVFVLFIVAIIVIVKRKRSKTTQPKRSRNQISAPSSPARKEPVNRMSTAPLMHGSTDKLLRDVSYSLIDDLSKCLNPKGRWKTLAGKLGFSSKDIENFELQPTKATEDMLSHWGQQRGSTLYHLHNVLKSLRWLDEADMVATYL